MAKTITREGLQIARQLMKAGTRKIIRRVLGKPQDVWGRQYVVWLDKNNMQPMGLWERQFSEHLPVPDKYLSIPEGQPWLVHTDLDRWYRDTARAHDEWAEREKLARREFYGKAGYTMEPTVESLAFAGPRPIPLELIALMSLGDPWCLGFQSKPTEAVLAVTGTEGELYERWVLGKIPNRKGKTDAGKMRLPRAVLELAQRTARPQVPHGPVTNAAGADALRDRTLAASGASAAPKERVRAEQRRTAAPPAAPASVPPVPPELRGEGDRGPDATGAPDPIDPEQE